MRVGDSSRRGGVEEEAGVEEFGGVRSFWIQLRIDVEERESEVAQEARS